METSAEIPLWLVITVVVVALLVGATMISAVVGKYAIHQWFHATGGPILTGFGVVLIGLSVYGNVTLKIGEFEAKIESLQASLDVKVRQVADLRKKFWSVPAELAKISETISSVSDNETNKLAANTKLAEALKQLNELEDVLSPAVAFEGGLKIEREGLGISQ